MRAGIALTFGVVVGLAVAGLPASASNQTIAAVDYTSWNPPDVTIQAGDFVAWKNTTGFAHNVCVRAPGATTGCDEYRSGDPSSPWPSEGYTHPFDNVGSYRYFCEAHPGMNGTITVSGTGTGTGTSTTPPPDTQPTDTITVPTQTQTAPVDTTAPAFVGTPRRRARRKAALILELHSSEDATLKAGVFRRRPGGRSFTRISEAALAVEKGRNVKKLPRTRVRSGAYRVKLQLVDGAGNKSATKTISFKIA
jgi:plastocyanin